MIKNDDEPLIKLFINWPKIKRYLVTGLDLVKKVAEKILKIILKLLTLLVGLLLRLYIGTRNFARSRQRGFWILLLGLILLLLLLVGKRTLSQKDKKYQELQYFHQLQNEEAQEMKKELEETKEKLETKLNRPPTVASAMITRISPLSEEIKQMVAKYADAYGVSRKYCECIITRESGGNPNAEGDRGLAHGVAQYHLKTYLGDAARVGLPVQDDRKNPDRAILAMAAALSRGEDSKWTEAKNCN